MPVHRASHAVIWVASAVVAGLVGPQGGPPSAPVSGRLTVLERGDNPAPDVGTAVIWLDGPATRPLAPRTAEVITEGKEFRPRVTVVTPGSTVRFPNNDPFNHNVFSRSDEAPFDLGLYGRKEARSVTFTRPGVVRVYCNVHATMAAFVLVRANGLYTQPGADGSFALDDVPVGRYTLHAWHERAAQISQALDVGPAGIATLDLRMDARAYQFVQHLNKFGQPYSRGGARY